MEITNLEQLKQMAEADILELPRFKKEIPFNVKVKRVSLLNLVRKGVIPNTLLSAAEELFYGKKSSKGVDLKEMTKVMFIMAENALVEPSIKDLDSVGLEFTDEQIVAIFNYTQEGIKEIEPFREEPKDNVDTGNMQTVQAEAK
ncbi:esterase [Clostridium estertheticum]|uniref:Esterase n=1 Tax=Clostridium estertheticum TaxID=238834 RepID=A0A5N7J2Y7_9CLOT|nr:esterase [Clostridium estertheticum]MPQ63101.1 esterase [Clostridium estertheticum]